MTGQIFGGAVQSSVKYAGAKPSVSVQYFNLLHLNLVDGAVNAVDQALNRFCAPEELTGGATHREQGAPVELCAGSCCCAVQVLCPEEMTPWISSVCALHLEFC